MEQVVEIIKFFVIVGWYFVFAPILGIFMAGRNSVRRFALSFISFMVVRPPGEFTLMLDSIRTYRGHTRGFEASLLEAICVAFIITAVKEKRRDFSWLPPGLIFWGLWGCLSSLSVVNAIEPVYSLMASFKFIKIGVVMFGVFAALHNDKDLWAIFRGFAVALIVQLIYCIWLRYGKGMFQIHGWFEHQNPMAMWCYTVGLPILGIALSRKVSTPRLILCMAAFGCGGIAVLFSVSRAALAIFAAGTAVVFFISLLQGLTFKKALFGGLILMAGVGAIAMAADTFKARIESAKDDNPENDLRWILNKQSNAMLTDHPLVGIGWNNFGLANSRPRGKYSELLEQWDANRGFAIVPDHYLQNPLTESLYWLFLAENGWLGFLSYCLFAAVMLHHALRSGFAFWKSPFGMLMFGIVVVLCLVYMHSRVERIITQTKNLTTLMILFGVVARARWWQLRKIDPYKIKKKRKKPQGLEDGTVRTGLLEAPATLEPSP
jgi:O-Antigen ligase